VGGALLAIGGGVVAYVGAIVFLVGASQSSTTTDDAGPGTLSDDERQDLRTVGGLMFLGGAAAGVGGLVMLLNNKTDVSFTQGGATRAPTRATAAGPALDLGRGFFLTTRGLAF
jgi:hypothetical protein